MAKAKDPVSGDEVDSDEVDSDEVDRAVSETVSGAGQTDPSKGTKYFHNGQWYYFSSIDSRVRFMAAPEKYV